MMMPTMAKMQTNTNPKTKTSKMTSKMTILGSFALGLILLGNARGVEGLISANTLCKSFWFFLFLFAFRVNIFSLGHNLLSPFNGRAIFLAGKTNGKT